MESNNQLPCYGAAPEKIQNTPWCQDCPLQSLAAAAVATKVVEQPVMTSAAGIEREIERVDCQGKQPRAAEQNGCGVRIVNDCGNRYLRGLVEEYQSRATKPVQE